METILKKILFTSFLVSAAMPSGVQAMSPEDIAEQVAEVAGQVISEKTSAEVVQGALAKFAAATITKPMELLTDGIGDVIAKGIMGVITGEGVPEVTLATLLPQESLTEVAYKVGSKAGEVLAVVAAPAAIGAMGTIVAFIKR